MKGIYDIHCHIVPGVDDGAENLKMSVRMLQKEYDDGVRGIIATPHFRYDMFEPSMELVKKQFLRLRKAAREIGDEGIEMYLGCELHSSMDMADCLKRGERLTMAGSRYVLAEFRTSDEKSYIRERIQALIRNGYYPIVAHVERYRSVVKSGIDFIDELRDMGAYIQMNADIRPVQRLDALTAAGARSLGLGGDIRFGGGGVGDQMLAAERALIQRLEQVGQRQRGIGGCMGEQKRAGIGHKSASV